jgi:hypothetical protein
MHQLLSSSTRRETNRSSLMLDRCLRCEPEGADERIPNLLQTPNAFFTDRTKGTGPRLHPAVHFDGNNQ